MLFNNIAYLDENCRIQTGKYIAVRGKTIDYIGGRAPAALPGERVYAGQGRLLLPGFFNAHSHTPMSLLRGYGEDMVLYDWLQQRIFPFEERLNDKDVYWATLLGCLEMLRYGIVGACDMYMRGDAMARGFLDGGVKANLSVGTAGFDDTPFDDLPQAAETRAMVENYHNADDGRLRIEYSLHAEYTSSEKLARSLAAAAARDNLAVHVHAAETRAEAEGCRERRDGRSPVRYLADCGLFDVPATAAHCVHIDDADIAILAEKGVNVATCPKSNLKLASGVCPAGALLAAGVNLALGTDSVASNNNLNFIEEMRVFSLLHKGISLDPRLITPAEALHAATAAGARAQRRGDCGVIRVGARADLVALDIDQPHWRPGHNLLHDLIFAADGGDILLTMVDGAVRYENNDWPGLDKEKIYAETAASCKRILSQLKS